MNLVSIVVFMCIIWILGVTVLRIVNIIDDYCILAPVIGVAIYSIVLSFLYFILDYSVTLSRTFLIFIASVAFIYLIFAGNMKNEVRVLMLLFVMFGFSIVPGVIGGEQYYFSRGNYWDHISYMSKATAVYDKPWSYYRGDNLYIDVFTHDTNDYTELVSKKEILENADSPILYKGSTDLFGRMTTSLVFSSLITKGRGDMFLIAYYFRMLLLALVILPILAFLLKLYIKDDYKKNNIKAIMVPIICAFAYVFGFWGQINYDIDAWAQNFFLPLILSAMFVFMTWLKKTFFENKSVKNNTVVLITILVACGLIYPEGCLCFSGIVFLVLALGGGVLPKINKFKEKLVITFDTNNNRSYNTFSKSRLIFIY